MEEIDIYRAAQQMINRYAENAVIEAFMRPDAALDQGDMFNFDVWKCVSESRGRALEQVPEGVGSRH